MKKTHHTYRGTIAPQNIIENLSCVIAPVVCFILFLAIIISLLGITGYTETHYSTTAEVLSSGEDTTLLVDGAGYVWELTKRPDLHKGQYVEIKFFNNTTDYTREDDEIIKVTLLDN